jgi:hypothetical protein
MPATRRGISAGLVVIAGLDPAIQGDRAGMDRRVKPGDDRKA